jgi:hypothetical protein
MKKQYYFIRNFGAGIYLENFLIAAVASLLGIRLFLKMTGYPQIGGAGLHIAHLLFGGFLMLASIIILLSFLSKATVHTAAIMGGIGFGLFIDEIGKFVTSDTDYFFKPAVAMISVTFILIFLTIRTIQVDRTHPSHEYLMNVLEEMKEAALHGLDEEHRNRALLYLEKSNAENPLVGVLSNSLSRIALDTPPKPGAFARIRRSIANLYQAIAQLRAFQYAIVCFFVVDVLIKMTYVFILVFLIGLRLEQILNTRIVGRLAQRLDHLSFIGWAQLAPSLLSGILTLLGLLWIRRSRVFAYRMFERSILVSIFITQVFIFYQEQLSALLGLFFNILVIVALRFMIDQERSRMARRSVR